MSERKHYGNIALAAGAMFFLLVCAYSLWNAQDVNRLKQEYAQACNKIGGVAQVIDGMYQCVKWEVR